MMKVPYFNENGVRIGDTGMIWKITLPADVVDEYYDDVEEDGYSF